MTTIPELLDGRALQALRPDRARARRLRDAAAAAPPVAATTSWTGLQREVAWSLRVLDVTIAVAAGAAVVMLVGASAGPWALAVAAGLPLATSLLGGTSRAAVRRGTFGRTELLRAAAGVALGCLVAGQLTASVPPVSVTLVGLPVSVGLMYLARLGAARGVRLRTASDRAPLRTLLLGAPPADLLTDRHLWDGYDVVGACASAPGEPSAGGLPVLGSVDRVAEVVAEHRIDVVLAAGAVDGAQVRQLSNALAGTEASLVVATGVGEVAPERVHVLPTAGAWNLRLLVEPRRPYVRGKAVLDRALGALLLLLALPVVLVAALAVRLTSPGPAFYGQTRVGRDGRTFRMWKLRSMVVGADALCGVLAEQNEGDGVLFKIRSDPRITPLGALLRRFSIDELPQLWNVVRGDMSLVGPRPPLPRETARYTEEESRRLLVRPGLTGLWQVSGRSDLSWADSVRLDLRYVDNWSLGMDIGILAATARAVVGGRGAY